MTIQEYRKLEKDLEHIDSLITAMEEKKKQMEMLLSRYDFIGIEKPALNYEWKCLNCGLKALTGHNQIYFRCPACGAGMRLKED